MNIFKNPVDLIGNSNTKTDTVPLKEILTMVQQFQIDLGKKAYLLDSYLSLLFEGINHSLAHDAAESGFQCSCDLQTFCISFLNKEEHIENDPFYTTALALFNSNKEILSFQESYTQANLLQLLLTDDYFQLELQSFIEQQNSSLQESLDEIKPHKLFTTISQLIGMEKMEQLNNVLVKKFLSSPSISVFTQGYHNDLLYHLSTKDMETNKEGFQLYLKTFLKDH